MEHPLTGTPTFYQDRKIIGVSSEAMPAFLQLFVRGSSMMFASRGKEARLIDSNSLCKVIAKML
jgi:hypothetical protein